LIHTGADRHSSPRRPEIGMLKRFLQRQTAASFDFEWRLLREHIEAGRAPQDQWRGVVDRLLTHQELCIAPEWFPGRRVLDLGCGMGRWLWGFVKLGAIVDAVDSSEAACQFLSRAYRDVASVRIVHADLFDLSNTPVAEERYDLIFAWGVLHHTGNTRRALEAVAKLARSNSLIYVFVYGRRSGSWLGNLAVGAIRLGLLPVPFRSKAMILRVLFRTDRATRSAFDQFSPLINSRHGYDEVSAWFRELGYTQVFCPYPEATQVFLRASRPECSATPYFVSRAERPYWWEAFDLRRLTRSDL